MATKQEQLVQLQSQIAELEALQKQSGATEGQGSEGQQELDPVVSQDIPEEVSPIDLEFAEQFSGRNAQDILLTDVTNPAISSDVSKWLKGKVTEQFPFIEKVDEKVERFVGGVITGVLTDTLKALNQDTVFGVIATEQEKKRITEQQRATFHNITQEDFDFMSKEEREQIPEIPAPAPKIQGFNIPPEIQAQNDKLNVLLFETKLDQARNQEAEENRLAKVGGLAELESLRPKPAQDKIDAAVDIGAGITSFITELALTRKIIGPGGKAKDILAFEFTHDLNGGTPGVGAGMAIGLGAINSLSTLGPALKSAPQQAIINASTKLGQGIFLGGVVKMQGGSDQQALIMTFVPLGMSLTGIGGTLVKDSKLTAAAKKSFKGTPLESLSDGEALAFGKAARDSVALKNGDMIIEQWFKRNGTIYDKMRSMSHQWRSPQQPTPAEIVVTSQLAQRYGTGELAPYTPPNTVFPASTQQLEQLPQILTSIQTGRLENTIENIQSLSEQEKLTGQATTPEQAAELFSRHSVEQAEITAKGQDLETETPREVDKYLDGQTRNQTEDIAYKEYTQLEDRSALKSVRERNKVIADINIRARDMNLTPEELQARSTVITGRSHLTAMTTTELESLNDGLFIETSEAALTESNQKLGITSDEWSDVEKFVKAPPVEGAKIKNQVSNMFGPEFQLSERPAFRNRQLDSMKLAANSASGRGERQLSIEVGGPFKRRLATFQDKFVTGIEENTLSMRHYMARREVETGLPFFSNTQSIIDATQWSRAQSTQAVDETLAQHGFTNSTLPDLTPDEAWRIGEGLFTGDENFIAGLSPKEQKSITALRDVVTNNPNNPLTGYTATRVRSVQWKLWFENYNKLMPKLQAEMDRGTKTDQGKVDALKKSLKNILPKNASAEDMLAIHKANVFGDYYKALSQATWGTRLHYNLSEKSLNVGSENIIKGLKDKSLFVEKNFVTRAPEPPSNIKSRLGPGTPVHKAPFEVIRNYAHNITLADELFYPMRDMVELTNQGRASGTLTEAQDMSITNWLETTAGKYKQVNPIIKGLNWTRRKFWTAKSFSPEFMAKFSTKQLLQNTLANGHVDMVAFNVSGAKAFNDLSPSTTKGDSAWAELFKGQMAKRGPAELSQRNALYELSMAKEAARSGPNQGRLKAWADLGTHGMGWTDWQNRSLFTGAPMHRMAFDSVKSWRDGKMSDERLFSTLKMDLFSAPERNKLMNELLHAKERDTRLLPSLTHYSDFIWDYSRAKIKDVHYGYGIAERTMLEQDPNVRSFLGPWTWGRSHIENFYKTGWKPISDGRMLNDNKLMAEGFKSWFKYISVIGGAAWLTKQVVGEPLYNLYRQSQISPGSPELSIIQDIVEAQNEIQWSIANDPAETVRKKAEGFAEVLLDVGVLAFAAPAVGSIELLERWAAQQNDVQTVKKLDLVKSVLSDEFNIFDEGKTVERDKAVLESIRFLIFDIDRTFEQQRKEERSAEEDPTFNIRKTLF